MFWNKHDCQEECQPAIPMEPKPENLWCGGEAKIDEIFTPGGFDGYVETLFVWRFSCNITKELNENILTEYCHTHKKMRKVKYEEV